MKKTLTIVSVLFVLTLSLIGVTTINSASYNYSSNEDFNVNQTSYQLNGDSFLLNNDNVNIINTSNNTNITYTQYNHSAPFTQDCYIGNNNYLDDDSCAVLTDKYTNDEAYIQIPFDAEETDNLVVSFQIKLLDKEKYNRIWFTNDSISRLNAIDEVDNICIESAFRDMSNSAFLTTYSKLTRPNSTDEHRNTELNVNVWENVRYEINQSEQSYNVYLNNELIAENIVYSLKDDGTYNTGIHNIVFGTGTSTRNSFCIDNVQVYNKETDTMIVNEKFNSFDNIDYSSGNNCDVQLAITIKFDNEVFAFTDNNTSAHSLLQYTFGESQDCIDCSFDIALPYVQEFIRVWFTNSQLENLNSNSNAAIYRFITKIDTNRMGLDGYYNTVNTFNIGQTTWNKVRFVIDLNTNRYSTYINGVLVDNNIKYNNSNITDINTIVIGSGNSSINLFHINNLSIKTGISQYDVNVDSVNGNVEYSPVKDHYDVGDEITITPIANEGYSFESLYINDIDITNELIDGSYTLTVGEEDVTIKPVFAANKYTITYNVDENCEIEATSQEVTYNASYSLLVPTKDGYTFDGWFNGTEKVEDGIWNNTNNIELTAQWTFIVVEEPFENNNEEENNDAVSGDSNTHQGANDEDLNDTVIQQPTEDSNLFDDKIANVNPSNNEDNSKEIIIIASAAAVGTSLLGLLLTLLLKKKKRAE